MVIIIRSHRCIKELRNDYGNRARIIPVLVYADLDHVKKRIAAEIKQHHPQLTEEESTALIEREVAWRREGAAEVWRDYKEDPFLYKHVIINNFSETVYVSIISRMVDLYKRP